MSPNPQELPEEDLAPTVIPTSALSAEETQAFAGLSATDTRALACAKVQECHDAITKLKCCIRELWSVHNSAVPLHVALPAELLIEIFRHLRPQKRVDIHCMHVCRYWRSLLCRTPEFWVDILLCTWSNPRIDDTDHPCSLPTLVRRCASQRFSLWLSSSQHLGGLLSLQDHMSRLKFLCVITDGCPQASSSEFPQLLRLPLPSLQHL
ncbi:hypothetical protein BV20DRAFT_244283 [Pilatotrama ljubarskyi]|nr:hypothetical protein BV20DRAFT_244283 [Pilatotrama ljubarskyi]